MAVIRFKPKYSWVVARWACRQITEDVLAAATQDSEIVMVLTEHADADGILLDLLEPRLAVRVSKAIENVAEGILSGAIRSNIYDKPFGNPHMIEEYQEGLRQLLDIIRRSKLPLKSEETR